jgi:hypothetical protein
MAKVLFPGTKQHNTISTAKDPVKIERQEKTSASRVATTYKQITIILIKSNLGSRVQQEMLNGLILLEPAIRSSADQKCSIVLA